MTEAVSIAAAKLGIPIRQGVDWDMDSTLYEKGEWDYPHFEMPSKWHLDAAISAMNRKRKELGLLV